MSLSSLLFSKSPTPCIVYHADTLEIEKVNQSASALYGYTKKELLNNTIGLLYPHENLQELTKKLTPKNSSDCFEIDNERHITKEDQKRNVNLTVHLFEEDNTQFCLSFIQDITNQNQIKREKQFSEKLIENLPGMFLLFDSRGNILQWNQEFLNVSGYTPQEINGESFLTFFASNDREDIKSAFKKILNNGRASLEGNLKTADGKNIPYMLSGIRFKEQGKKFVAGIGVDISKRISYFQALEKKKKQLARAQNVTNTGSFEWDVQNNIIEWSDQSYEIYGLDKNDYPKTEICDFFNIIHPEDREYVKNRIDNALSEGEFEKFTYRVITPSGKEKYLIQSGKVEFDADGSPQKIFGTMQDVTENQKNREKIKQSLQWRQAIMESATDAVIISDEEGRILDCNRSSEKIFGYTKEELVGSTLTETIIPESKANKHQQSLWPYKQADIPSILNEVLEMPARRKDGSIFTIELTINKIKGSDPVKFVGILRDISEKVEKNKKLKRNKELFQNLFYDAPVAMAMTNAEEKVKSVNKSFEELYGFEKEELTGQALSELLLPEDSELESPKSHDELFGDKNKCYQGKRKAKDGELKDVSIAEVPVSVDGEPVTIFSIHVDLTKLKATQSKLEKSLKQTEILLGEVHHRVKNNLSVILGLLKLEAMEWQFDEQAQNAFENIQTRIYSIAKIHEKLYQSKDLVNINISEYISELVELIQNRYATNSSYIETKCETIALNINQAIPLALITNELIIQYLRNGNNNHQHRNLNISLNEDEGMMNLDLHMQPSGLWSAEDLETGNTLESKIVSQLIKQLQADMHINEDDGLYYNIQFKKSDASGSAANHII